MNIIKINNEFWLYIEFDCKAKLLHLNQLLRAAIQLVNFLRQTPEEKWRSLSLGLEDKKTKQKINSKKREEYFFYPLFSSQKEALGFLSYG